MNWKKAEKYLFTYVFIEKEHKKQNVKREFKFDKKFQFICFGFNKTPVIKRE